MVNFEKHLYLRAAFFAQPSEMFAPDPTDFALSIVLVPGEPNLTLHTNDLFHSQHRSIIYIFWEGKIHRKPLLERN